MKGTVLACALACVTSLIPADAIAAECQGFKWDVSPERAIFGGAALELDSGHSPVDAPLVQAGQLIKLKLSPLANVQFAVAPERPVPQSSASGGLLRFLADRAGTYRVALSEPLWIDVVHSGKALPSKDFSGSSGCHTPHKVVIFDFPADGILLLQISGKAAQTVDLSILAQP